MLLRVVIGFHFYKEGTGKLRQGDWNGTEYFLKGAKGPLAPHFQSLIRDTDGREKLCIVETENENGDKRIGFDTDLTFYLWDDFIDQATSYYGFGSEQLQQEIQTRREKLAEEIERARNETDRSVDTRALEAERKLGEANILLIREQIERAEEILQIHKDQLTDYLNVNKTEIFSHFATQNRLDGFERDGVNRKQTATYVDSLREQVDTIRSDRAKQLGGWAAEVESIWDSFETQVNNLAVDRQANELEPMELHRPFDQPKSNLNMLNKFIPWFDTIVGVLLILGLFTRLASLAGAGFLASVIATQPPWIPGTTPTYYQAIELFALLVIFATCAGRMGGLDYFFSNKKTLQTSLPEN